MTRLPSRLARRRSATLVLCALLAAANLPTSTQAQDIAAPPAPPAPPAVVTAPPLPAFVVPPPFQGARELNAPRALGVTGSVLGVHDLAATISVGATAGITPGTRILFISAPARPDDPFARNEAQEQVIGEVVNVTEDRALVSVGMLESVSVGQRVEVTALRPSARRIAPPRPPAMLILEGGLRAFLPIRRVSVGGFADLALTYLPKIPMFVRAELFPFGGRAGAGADMGALGGLVSAGYDQRYIGIGLGAGILYHRNFVETHETVDGQTRLGAAVPRFQFAQLLRAGARDGLHLSVKTAFALASERWRVASVVVAGQVPVAARFALTPRIVVAPGPGIFLAEIGVRILARGDGGHGSLFVRPVAGISGTYDADHGGWDSFGGDNANALDAMLYGPMLGVDVEFRL